MHSIISDQAYDAPTSQRTMPECESFEERGTGPKDVGGSSTSNSDVRSITADSDENWGIAGGKYGAVNLRKTLRAGRETRGRNECQSTGAYGPQTHAKVDILAVARGIKSRVSNSIRDTALCGVDAIVSVLAIAEFMFSDPTLTPASVGMDRYLGMYLLIGDNRLDFRCHDGDLYQCGDDLVYACTMNPPILRKKEAEILSALDGLFIYAAVEKKEIIAISLRRQLVEFPELEVDECTEESLLAVMHHALRKNWDYAKVSTKGRPYAAHDGAKFADIASKARAQLQSDLRKGKDSSMWSTFATRCESEMPPIGGVKLPDCYMNKDWTEEVLTRGKNCYSRLPYKFRLCDADCLSGYTVETQLGELDLFIDSAFYDNDPWLLCSLCTMKLAMRGVPTEKMFYIVGPGGDSKGLVAALEQGFMGGLLAARSIYIWGGRRSLGGRHTSR